MEMICYICGETETLCLCCEKTYELPFANDIYDICHGEHRDIQGYIHRRTNRNPVVDPLYWLENLLLCMIMENHPKTNPEQDEIVEFVDAVCRNPIMFSTRTQNCVNDILFLFGKHFRDTMFWWFDHFSKPDDTDMSRAWKTPE